MTEVLTILLTPLFVCPLSIANPPAKVEFAANVAFEAVPVRFPVTVVIVAAGPVSVPVKVGLAIGKYPDKEDVKAI